MLCGKGLASLPYKHSSARYKITSPSNRNRLSNMRRDKYDDNAEERGIGISTTTNMAAAEQSVHSALETVLNQLDGLISLKEEQEIALNYFCGEEITSLVALCQLPSHMFRCCDW